MNEADSGVASAGMSPGGRSNLTATLRVPAQTPYLALIGSVVRWFGRHAGLSEEKCFEIEVVVDEVCTNVVRYAFPAGDPGEMSVAYSKVDSGLKVEISDRGQRFDLAEADAIARRKQAQDPASGGMGLSLIRQLADEFNCHWDERSGNRFTVIKRK